ATLGGLLAEFVTDGLADSSLGESITIGLIISVYGLSSLIYLFVFAYIKARTYNLVYQNTIIRHHRLRANTKAVDLAWLYFSNTLMIILTIGLFIPFAKVRTARYLADHTALQVKGELDDFIATAREEQAVWGEELGEVFDLDVGL
ncbi:MAG: DUF898 family protein, partial [Pseudomonadota bacterium]